MSDTEDKPLIEENASQRKTSETKVQFSTTKVIILSFATALFNCSLQISNLTVNQYVYKWLDVHHGNRTADRKNFSTSQNNTSGCPVNENSDENELQQSTSTWLWYFTLTEYGLPLFTVLTLGLYSDFFGRKPLMLLSLFGNTIMSGLIILFIYMDWYLAYFVIAFGVGGISGARYSFHIGYLGSVADTTDKSKARSFKIAILDILMALGRSSAQLTTGYVIKFLGYVYPVIISCGCCFTSFILVFLFIPETKQRGKKSLENSSIRQAYHNIVGLFRIKNRVNWKFILCFFSFIVFFMPYVCRINIEILFQLRSPFCYTSDMISWFQFSKECVQNILGTALIKVFHRCCSDELIVLLGCVTGTSYFVVEAFAKESSVLFIGIAVGILATVPFPLYRGLASRMVDDDKQGALFTVLVVLQIIGRLCGTTAYNNLYSYTQDRMAGLTFLVMGGCYMLASLIILPLLVSRTSVIGKKTNVQSD